MSVKLRGKTYSIVFRPFGQQIMLALKDCQNKRQAGFIEDELMYALVTKDYGRLTGSAREACIRLFRNQKWEFPPELPPTPVQNPSKEFTLWDAVQLYVNDESFKCLSRPDIYMTKLAHVVKFLGKSKPLKELWIPNLKLYRSHRTSQGASNASINRELAALSGVFRVAIEHQIIEISPCRQIKKLSEKSGQRQVYLSFEDVNRIMDACPLWFQDIIKIAYLSGMRKGEIHRLRWSHINLTKRIISFHSTETKEGKSKRVPIHKDLVQMLERIGKIRSLNDDLLFQINGHHVSYDSLQHPWFRALDKLNWVSPRPRFHDLRHTWKTNARRSGLDHEIREMILGHSDRTLDVSERYGFIDDNELVTAIDKFTYDNGLTQILVAPKEEK